MKINEKIITFYLYIESSVSRISSCISFSDLLKVFFSLSLRIWGILFQILTPTREKAFRLTLSRDSLV